MGVITTKAIVLSSIKYGDSSLIVKCFTLEEGLKTYLVRGILKASKSKIKAAYFQPLSQLKLEAKHNNKGALNSIKEVHVLHPYKNIHSTIYKQTIVLFLSEMLNNTIQEEEKNEPLYTYLETAFLWLDAHDDISNFHLIFLLNLTKFLGFYPDVSGKKELHFNLSEGSFTNETYGKEIISGDELFQLKKLLGIHFDTINSTSFNKRERQQVLRIIIRYFELHLDGFRNPKSLDILETVFS